MQSLGMRCFFVLFFVIVSQATSARDFGGYATVTSDYVKRGVSQSDGGPAVQVGVELSDDGGFFVGAWGSTTKIRSGPTNRRDREVNYYAGFGFDATDALRFSATAVAYRYPGQSGDVNYNYEEYSLTANFADRSWLEFAYSPDLYNSGRSSTNVDLFAEWPLSPVWSIGGGGGYYDTSRPTGRAYSYWQLGVTASLRWADVDLRFHDTAKWVPIVSSRDRIGSRLVLTIQIPF